MPLWRLWRPLSRLLCTFHGPLRVQVGGNFVNVYCGTCGRIHTQVVWED